MRKMKAAAVLTTAALLAIGASMTSMAATKGTWELVDGEWYCYDSDGDVIENEFCLSNGKEYYVGDDGVLASSEWVEDDGDYFFVNSAGEKVRNDWRYTTPYEDEEGDEEWYYFKSNGKRAEDEKLVINGKTYFFDGEGVMLTGWVYGDSENGYDEATNDELGGKTYFCNEEGARVSKEWVKTYAPSVDEDEDDVDEDDMNWYYIKSSGKPATKKQSSINGQTYFFDLNGVMLSGWVAGTSSNYKEIWTEDSENGTAVSAAIAAGNDVYFCGDEEDGHAKKSGWFKTYASTDYGMDDSDNDEYWYYAQSNGKVYVPTEGSAAQEYDLDDITAQNAEDGDIANDSRFSADATHTIAAEKKLNGEYYLFNQDGQMISGFVEMGGEVYYYGGSNDGAKKDGSFTLTDDCGETAKCYFATESTATGYVDCAGINGAKNGKLYASGVLVKAEDAKYEIKVVDGMEFVVNKSGSIQSDKGPYKEDGEPLFGGAEFTYDKLTKGVSYNSVATMK